MTVHGEHTFLQAEKLQLGAYPTQLCKATLRHKPTQAQGLVWEGHVAPSPSVFRGASYRELLQKGLQLAQCHFWRCILHGWVMARSWGHRIISIGKTIKIIQSNHQPMPVTALDHDTQFNLHSFLENLQEKLHHKTQLHSREGKKL